MSTDRRIAGLADDEYAITATFAALTATTHPTIRRSVDPPFLPSISHPPDLATHVVAHQQRAVRQDQQANRPAPARAAGALPAYDEVFDAGGAPATAVHLHAHDLGAGRDGPVPGPVQGHERRAAILAGELRARIEREAERRGVGLHRDGGRLDLRAVSRSVLGIGLARQITLWPPVVAAVLDDVDMLGGHVVAEVVAVVVAAPELAGRGVECHPDGIAQSLREDPATGAVGIELCDGGAHRVALVAQVTRRAGGHVHLAIRPEQNGPRRVAAATRNPSDRFAFRCTGTESLHGADVGDVHRVAAERDAERSLEAGGDRHGTFGDAVVVRIGEFDDHAGSRLRRVYTPSRAVAPSGIRSRLASACAASRSTCAVISASTSPTTLSYVLCCF